MAPSAAYVFGRSLWVSAYREFVGMRTLEQALETYGPHARARLLPLFRERGISYPPRGVSLLAI